MIESYIDRYPGCRIALFPTLNSTDGTLSYDLSHYPSIQSVGYATNHYCVQALNMPGIPGTGGIDSAGKVAVLKTQGPAHLFLQGDNNKLRLIVYAPLSKFENDTIADYKQNRPIAIQEDTDDEYGPAPPDPGPLKKRTRFGRGGLGSRRIKGEGSKVRNLRDDWYMSYESTTFIVPPQIGAANLETFYTQVVDSAANQISTVANATENLTFSFNGLNFLLSSSVLTSKIVWYGRGMLFLLLRNSYL